MPSARVQRQIDRLLDEAEAAAEAHDWPLVDEGVRMVLRLDAANSDARAFAAMVDEARARRTRGVRSLGGAEQSVPTTFGDGRYAIRVLLGDGATKRVFRAHDEQLDRDVALAVLRTEGLGDTARARLAQEARTMGRLGSHPHLVTLHDVQAEGDELFLVEELMDRSLLDELERRGGTLPLRQVLTIGGEICAALAFIHRQRLVHRDLKPSNVFLTAAGTVKLGDFGLAVGLDGAQRIQNPTLVGTAAYMPPEQALGDEVGPASDLYALGATLYELVAGRPPFLGDDPVAVISQHLHTAPVAPSWHSEHCPPDLDELILHLLAKDPGDRPGSASDVQSILAAVDPRGVSAVHRVADQNPLERLTARVFVGRQRELFSLRAAFDAAVEGRGSAVVIGGEPGVGKTRLIQELDTYARLRGGRVLWGRAPEDEGAPPYWPWVEVGRAWRGDAQLAQLAERLAGLGPQPLADLLALFPDWSLASEDTSDPVVDPESARWRLFEAYAAFVRLASEREPIVVVVDDLQWTDAASLSLFRHLARGIAGERILLVGAYRSTELAGDRRLGELLAQVDRDATCDRIELGGLTADEVAGYVAATAGAAPSAVTRQIHAQTAGNAFFVSEVVKLLAQEGTLTTDSLSGVALPASVRGTLRRRLDQLSTSTQDLLRTAAVVGREFELATLEALEAREAESVLPRLDEALAARVIEESETGRYRFVHAQMLDTLLAEFSRAGQARLHARIGDTLEQRQGSAAATAPSRLARHFAAAAEVDKAYAAKAAGFARRAAEQAEGQAAWEEAGRQYLAAAIALGASADGMERAALQRQAAINLARDGLLDAAWESFSASFELYRDQGDVDGMTTTLFAAAEAPWMHIADRRVWSEIVLEQLDAESDDHLRALLLLECARFDPSERADRHRQDAAAIATGRFPDIEFQLQIGRILKMLEDRRYRDVLDWSDAALASGELPPEALGTIAYLRIGSLNCLGEIETLDREAGRFAAQMHALRLPNHERFARFHTLGIAVGRGDRETALAEAERSTAAGDTDSEEVVRALFDRAPSHADPALLSANLTQEDAAISISIRGLAAAWAREPDVARGAYAAARELRGAVEVPINRFVTTLRLAELGIEVGATADLPEYEAALIDYHGLSTWDAFPSLTDLVVARLRLALGDPDAARTLAAQAHDWAHERGLPFLSGQALLVQGQAEQELGLADAALESVDSAIALFRRHEIQLMRDIALTDRVRLQLEAGHASVTSSIDALALSVEAEPVNLRRQAAPDGTVTLLFSDIENSTARTAELGDAKWMELLREHNAIVRDQLAAHSGYEVKSMGDGFMLAFRSALDGLRCAIGMQQAFAARNASADEPLRVRVGLHTGEAIREADDFFGSHVNLAARVGGAAMGDEILVSGLLKALTESAGEFTFDEGHEVELKGISEPQRVHAVEWR